MANIGGNLYKRNQKNPNNSHKDVNHLLSVIIVFGTDVHGCENSFSKWNEYE